MRQRCALPAVAAILLIAACTPSQEGEPAADVGAISGEWSFVEHDGFGLSILSDGTVSGTRGCTQFSSFVTMSEDSYASFSDFASDGVSCGDESDAFWEVLVGDFSSPVRASLHEGSLILGGHELAPTTQ